MENIVEAIVNLVEFARQSSVYELEASERILDLMDLSDEAFIESYRLVMDEYSSIANKLR